MLTEHWERMPDFSIVFDLLRIHICLKNVK